MGVWNHGTLQFIKLLLTGGRIGIQPRAQFVVFLHLHPSLYPAALVHLEKRTETGLSRINSIPPQATTEIRNPSVRAGVFAFVGS